MNIIKDNQILIRGVFTLETESGPREVEIKDQEAKFYNTDDAFEPVSEFILKNNIKIS